MSDLSANLRVIRASLGKNWRISTTSPSYVINRLISPFVWVSLSVFAYTGLAGEELVASRFKAETGSASFTGFLILGQTLFSFFMGMNWRGGMAIQRERWYGTLEIILLAPTSRIAFVLGESLYGLLDSGWTIFLAMVLALFLFGADFSVADPLAVALSVALTLLAMVALGVFFAGFYVLTRSAGPLSFALQGPVRFLSGTQFPLTVLPVGLQAVGYAIPVTFGLIAVRATTLGGARLADVAPELAGLAVASAVFFVAGAWLIRRMEARAKRSGTLSAY